MTIFLVSRHLGALEWVARKGIAVDVQLTHLDIERVGAGDTLLGTLPVQIAAEVCARGARYFHLSIEMPESWRDRELSADDLDACGAKLEDFFVEKRG